MSGHSKWSSIKHKKAIKDQRRGKLFTKLIREITIAARGGVDPTGNPRLRTAIAAAKAVSMPNDNIDRAMKKASGGPDGQQLEEIDYEGYGPGGVAVIVRVLTDNRNRTVSEIRYLFSKHGGSLGEAHCVAWMFDKRGVILLEGAGVDEERAMEAALEAGAVDFTSVDEVFEVMTPPERLDAVREAVERGGFKIRSAEVTMVPKTTVQLAGEPAAAALKLLELLEDQDDVQNVSANLDIDPEEAERLSAA
ncbi:MAG: YebC/PmpR family DNA-binding transcriptional regulator [Candidatus Binatia bacterium]